MNAGLTQAIRELHLSGLAQSLNVRLAEASGNHLGHDEFLELVLRDELAVRGSRQVERRVKAALFRERRNLDEFDFAFNPSRRYLKPDLLIIDDMGMKQLPRRSGECLLEIILRRHENRSTMMTSNRPLEDWAKLIGDVPAATAILDRFLQHAQVITITGRSYRLKDHPRVPAAAEQKKEQKGRPAAGGEGLSPPEDTGAPVSTVSSDGGKTDAPFGAEDAARHGPITRRRVAENGTDAV